MLPSNTARQIMQGRPLVMLVLGPTELAARLRHLPLILSIVPSVRNSGFWNARVLFPRRRPRLASPRTIAPNFCRGAIVKSDDETLVQKLERTTPDVFDNHSKANDNGTVYMYVYSLRY